jgi:hypothetical protein
VSAENSEEIAQGVCESGLIPSPKAQEESVELHEENRKKFEGRDLQTTGNILSQKIKAQESWCQGIWLGLVKELDGW